MSKAKRVQILIGAVFLALSMTLTGACGASEEQKKEAEKKEEEAKEKKEGTQ